MDHYAAYAGVQYSPLDMAEYVFWTGDEVGVTTAVEEFLQEGIVSDVYKYTIYNPIGVIIGQSSFALTFLLVIDFPFS